MESPVFRHAVVRHIDDCPTEEWTSPTRGSVRWWELFGGDATATNEMTVGIAEVPVGATPPPRGHSHDATEIYVILSGEGDVVIEGNSTPVREGSVPLRLLYMFARDKFSDVTYSFPGEN